MQTITEPMTIVVGEDEPEIRQYLEMALRCQGYTVEMAEDGEEVMALLRDRGQQIAAVLLDLSMPRKDGLTTLREIRRADRALPVIMLSCTTSPLKAVEAMKSGATDFLSKPVDPDELGKVIKRNLAVPAQEVNSGQPAAPPSVDGVVLNFGGSAIQRSQSMLRQIGASDAPVLLQGETGVGKEIMARQLHAQSSRAGKPFVKLNCAALPSELVESELFGYERGAFTGAFKDKPGKFELAEGGTIMLDEIGDMDFKLQAKLLQVLQDHEYQRLGGKETVRVNVRVMAATHCDLEKAIREGRFREDLYYRLNVIKLQLPPLRECKERILPLAEFFLKKYATPGMVRPELPQSLKQALEEHDWPGNIRELENIIRRFLVFSDGDIVAEELRFKTRRKVSDSAATVPVAVAPIPQELHSHAPVLQKVEHAKKQAETEAIVSALSTTHWNRKQAAALLHIDYKAFLYKMKKLGIEDKVVTMSVAAR